MIYINNLIKTKGGFLKIKEQKGITLVALFITIIILLILAGIAIASLAGDNGLFKRANQAKNNTLDAQKEENIRLQNYEYAINDALNGLE